MTDQIKELTEALSALITLAQAGGGVGLVILFGLFLKWLIPALKNGKNGNGHSSLESKLVQIATTQEAHTQTLQNLAEANTELLRLVETVRREQAMYQAQSHGLHSVNKVQSL